MLIRSIPVDFETAAPSPCTYVTISFAAETGHLSTVQAVVGGRIGGWAALGCVDCLRSGHPGFPKLPGSGPAGQAIRPGQGFRGTHGAPRGRRGRSSRSQGAADAMEARDVDSGPLEMVKLRDRDAMVLALEAFDELRPAPASRGSRGSGSRPRCPCRFNNVPDQ